MSISAAAKKAWHWIGHIHQTGWLLEFFPSWKAALTAAIISGLLALWGWVVALPPPEIAAVGLVAFAALLIVIRLALFFLGHFQNDSTKKDRVTRDNGYNPATSVLPSAPAPDWPIRDLFFHIGPDILDDETRPDSPWEVIGRDVIDRISAGQLQVWGREFNAQDRRVRTPLAPIRSDRWVQAEFSYFFIAEDHANVVHVTCERPGQSAVRWQYCDLQFNRAQALTIWPESPTLSLIDAARSLRRELAGTTRLARIEQECISDDEVLDSMATMLLAHTPATGIRPGNLARESVRTADKRYAEIKGGAKALRSRDRQPRTIFTKLEVFRQDLAQAIAGIKARAND